MNLKEYNGKMELLQKQLEDTNKQIEELKNIKIVEDASWKPEMEELYWYISRYGTVEEYYWLGTYGDYDKLSIGNVFKTKEQAEYEVEKLKVITELKRFSRNFEIHKNKYCIKYDRISENIDVYNNYGYATGELRFASEKDAKDAIEFVGKHRVLKYYLGVEEK